MYMTVYDELVENINDIQTIDTSDLVKKADYNTNIRDIENEITYYDKLLIMISDNKYITTYKFDKLIKEVLTKD